MSYFSTQESVTELEIKSICQWKPAYYKFGFRYERYNRILLGTGIYKMFDYVVLIL